MDYRMLDKDPEAQASFERCRHLLDERMAFAIAATDSAFRYRVKTGHTPLNAYAHSLGELAKINAIVEGYGPAEASEREEAIKERALREGPCDHGHPIAMRLCPPLLGPDRPEVR